MDDVVRLVYQAIEQIPHLENTLFVLLGDHGMTEQGNHGGASPSEIAAAMVFMSPKLKAISPGLDSPVPATVNYEYYSVINQIDFVPTLAGLMGFTIPAKSLGVFVADFLSLFQTGKESVGLLYNNAQQLRNLLESEYDIRSANTTICSDQCENCQSDLDQVVCWLNKANIAKEGWAPTNATNTREVRHTISIVSSQKF